MKILNHFVVRFKLLPASLYGLESIFNFLVEKLFFPFCPLSRKEKDIINSAYFASLTNKLSGR